MQFVIVFVILTIIVLFVTAPLRRAARARDAGEPETGQAELAEQTELEELQAERDAKYREIRDAELDHSTGKLSDEDFAAVDEALRAEAIAILKKLDRAQGRHEA